MTVKERVGQTAKLRLVDKVLYRMVPLLSASELLETHVEDKQMQPFRRVDTEFVGKLIGKGLRAQGIEEQKKGKKTNLIRDSYIDMLNLKGGELQPPMLNLHKSFMHVQTLSVLQSPKRRWNALASTQQTPLPSGATTSSNMLMYT